MKKLVLILISATAMTAGCSNSKDVSPRQQKGLACGDSNTTTLSAASCPKKIQETVIPSEFYSEALSIKKWKNSFVVLKSVAAPNFIPSNPFKSIHDFTNATRGALTLTKDNLSVWTISSPDLDIFDFDINTDGKIIAIAARLQSQEDLPTPVKVLLISADGQILQELPLLDADQNQDNCINLDSSYVFGDCKTLDTKSSTEISFPQVRFHSYRMAKILWSKKSNSFYTIVDRGHREVTTMYAWDISSGTTSLKWKTPIINGTKFSAGPQISLSSGHELFGLNRFGRFIEKYLAMDEQDNIYVSVNGLHNPKLDIYPFLSIKNGVKEEPLVFNNYNFLIKLSPSGQYLWSTVVGPVNDDTSSTDLAIRSEHIDILSNMQSNGKYKAAVTRLNTNTGEFIEPTSIINIPGNVIGLAIDSINEDQVVVTGLSGFEQNPVGMSLSTYGQSFIASYEYKTQLTKIFYLKKSSRKDTARDFVIDQTLIHTAIDLDGPITHSADQNLNGAKQTSSIFTFPLTILD